LLIFAHLYLKAKRIPLAALLHLASRHEVQDDERKPQPKNQPSNMQKSIADFKAVCFTLPFWTLNLRLTILVTFGSLFIANVDALGRYHGADQSSIAAVRQHFTFFLGGLGITNPVPGYIIKRLGTHKGIAVVASILIVFVAVWIFGTLYDKNEFNGLFYVAFASFALWRYWSYGVCALYVPTIFPDRPAGFGLILGCSGTIAGAVSVAIGSYVTHAMQDSTDKAVPIVVSTFGALSILAEVFTIIAVVMLMKRTNQHQPLIPPRMDAQPPPSRLEEEKPPPLEEQPSPAAASRTPSAIVISNIHDSAASLNSFVA